ncbi:hypothetical protein SAMN05660420_01830 [Desulfuromusa kysingii]|uniref:Nif11 domain-containing protein n=1 Tax=Desulfuromusa kysingii TaxID=37625 RepID=A0A1H4AHL6_9BACT|nr:Os1348 family NHLP clan protein [Desulfuromusa kysingii]SEA35082.1 hypothetical protein SAMN05660420_01830 [Desulfuromusa kysingii]
MSQNVVEQVLGRLITDERFRHRAAESFAKACQQEGYLLAPNEVLLLANLKQGCIAALSDEINPGLRRAGG